MGRPQKGDRGRFVRLYVHTFDSVPVLDLDSNPIQNPATATTYGLVLLSGTALDVGTLAMFLKDCPVEPPLLDASWYQDGVCLRHVRETELTDDGSECCDDCIAELRRKLKARKPARRPKR